MRSISVFLLVFFFSTSTIFAQNIGLHIEHGTDVVAGGYGVFGPLDNDHISISNWDIQSKNNQSSFRSLYLNYYGGNVDIGASTEGGDANVSIGAWATNRGFLNCYNTFFVDGDSDNVGIGTNSPSEKFHLSTTGGKMLLGSPNGAIAKMTVNAETGTEIIRFRSNGSTKFFVDEEGYAGINVSSSIESDLHINQSGGFSSDQETGGICLENGTNRWRVYNSAAFLRFNFSNDDGSTYTPKGYINNSDGAYVSLSDESLKKNIKNINAVLPLLMQLSAKNYNYIDHPENAKKSIGYIAQEVNELFPELVSTENEGGLLGINYARFGVIAIQAIQEQQVIIENYKTELDKLKEEVDALKNLIKK